MGGAHAERMGRVTACTQRQATITFDRATGNPSQQAESPPLARAPTATVQKRLMQAASPSASSGGDPPLTPTQRSEGDLPLLRRPWPTGLPAHLRRSRINRRWDTENTPLWERWKNAFTYENDMPWRPDAAQALHPGRSRPPRAPRHQPARAAVARPAPPAPAPADARPSHRPGHTVSSSGDE